jgi:hypothetical protein
VQENVWQNQPEKRNSGDWFLQHDKAHTRSALSVCEFLAKNMTVVPQPPYSPDLVLCDFFIFQKLNMVLKGGGFNVVTMIQTRERATLA